MNMPLRIGINDKPASGTVLSMASGANLEMLVEDEFNSGDWKEMGDLIEAVLGLGVEVIGKGAFKNCRMLAKVAIPDTVIRWHRLGWGLSIGAQVFLVSRSPTR